MSLKRKPDLPKNMKSTVILNKIYFVFDANSLDISGQSARSWKLAFFVCQKLIRWKIANKTSASTAMSWDIWTRSAKSHEKDENVRNVKDSTLTNAILWLKQKAWK